MTRTCLLVLCLAAAAAGCNKREAGSGTPNTPTGPSARPASVTISDVSVTPERAGTGYRYVVRFTVRETGGSSAATLGVVELAFFAGDASIGGLSLSDAFSSNTLNAGSSMQSRTINATDSNPGSPQATRVEIRVSYSDATGASSRVTQTSDISRLANPPVIVEFTADRTFIEPGQSATLRWNVTGASLVTLEPPRTEVSAQGTRVVTPTTTTTYRLASANSDGGAERNLTVAVAWNASGVGNTVFDMPRTVSRVRITGTYRASGSNFIVWVGGRLVVNEIIGVGRPGGPTYTGVHAVTGGEVRIENSRDVEWTFMEAR